MPTTRSFTSSYAGKAAAGYILPALAGGETAATRGINIETGVKFEEKIKKFDSSNVIQSASTTCDLYTPSGTLTISEQLLKPVPFKINADICFADVYKLWDQPSPDGMNNENMSAELEDAVIASFTEKSAEFIDQLIWQGGKTGATGNLTLINGWAKQIDANGGVLLSGTTVTSANVLTEMNKVVNALPAGVKKNKANLVLFVPYSIAFLYEQNLAAQGFNTSAEGQSATLYGIEVRAVGGMLDNTMCLGERSNFYIATDLEGDWSEVALIDKRYTTGDEVISFKMKYKVDAKVGFPAEAVLYGARFY